MWTCSPPRTSRGEFPAAVAALVEALGADGFEITVVRQGETLARLVVTDHQEGTVTRCCTPTTRCQRHSP